ncbi:exodeoxyribonuclease VII large subunit [Alkaliphilus sp. B6464]|uniref:exodeoxyribonuclease VII large subunit n=1 Tax=Alkaliphilus sp. B6464 TaxID=2731219 RepID=UPI001BABBA02|nr:exodeoxyribonuclease VII large subunit [Alkaliphilus sp. B6464]QUH20698.1 exodeoxyribonuclease VII large subunit [Alkaliphilus sp. B6464]
MQIKALSISEVNQYIKRILVSDPILGHIHVKGEVSNYKFHSSGHMYFTLKDQNSRINCVMFKSNCEKLKFLPNEGMSLICKGYVSIYERDGQYQLYVTDMEPLGLGSLHLAYQQLKDRLDKEGIFDIKYKKQLPYIPRKIAIITSPTGAAIRDIISVIFRRFPKVELYVFPVLVQGEAASTSIANAIDLCNRFSDIDIAIIGRGGGSMEELWAFNEEKVARAIFNSHVPIVSAVGHETDFTIADFVADLRAPTPSAAAELVVPDILNIKDYMNSAKKRLLYFMNIKIKELEQRLYLIENNYFFKYPLNQIYDKQQYIDELLQRLNKYLRTKIEFNERHLMYLGERLNGLSPLSVFSRGYSIVRDEKNQIIKSVDQVRMDRILSIDLIDGEISCRVIKCIKEEKAFVKS